MANRPLAEIALELQLKGTRGGGGGSKATRISIEGIKQV